MLPSYYIATGIIHVGPYKHIRLYAYEYNQMYIHVYIKWSKSLGVFFFCSIPSLGFDLVAFG